MGIAFSAIQKMDELGLFCRGGVSILDIGSSNLYSATAADIKGFLGKYGKCSIPDVDEFSARLAAGSGYDPVSGGRNEAFVGELFEKAGMQYVSFDIAAGHRTTVLDLNQAALPDALRGEFDLVLNFGTTEHILNQLNCFKVIHDATKVGGYIFHSLPAVGYVDHGYITYTGRCFFDVAGFNEYELVACWFDGPSGGGCVLDSLKTYSLYFPALETELKRIAATEQGRILRDLRIPDIGINVVYRKVKDRLFLGALESSTSVGDVPQGVAAVYGATDHAVNQLTSDDQLTTEELALRDRLLAGTATLDEALRLYSMMSGRGLAFPLAWEELALRLCLRAEPDRLDLNSRLRRVLIMQGKPVPPEVELAVAGHAAQEKRARDH